MAARQVVLMLTPEVGAVQTTLNTLKALAGLGLTDQQTSLVLNYISPEPGLTQAAVEKAIGRAPDLSVPFDRAQAAALTQGAPLVFGQAASPLVAALGPFALKL
jgi:Flp pilus assembly CpaE family ATPase